MGIRVTVPWVTSARRLHRVHRGVYAVGHPNLTEKGRWMAAVRACGDGAALSHLSAAHLLGFSFWSGDFWWPEHRVSVEIDVLGHMELAAASDPIGVVTATSC